MTFSIRFRDYNPHTDRDAGYRIWHEVGWLGKDEEKPAMDRFIDCGRAMVVEVNGDVECLVLAADGTVRHLREDLRLSAVTGVTTSRVARKLGLARRLTAKLLAREASDGMQVAGLGMFEQGYYNGIGFGTGGYEHTMALDPATIRVPAEPGIPRRFTRDDWAMLHAARLSRHRTHGAVNLVSPEMTRVELQGENAFGLGYIDETTGEMTHGFWCEPGKLEFGPYRILWMAYRTREQFLELMALLHSLGDQVRLIEMVEPPLIQLQDLVDRPFRGRMSSRRSDYEQRMTAEAYWQMRILDLPGCIARTHLPGANLRFQLRIEDPIEQYLDESDRWQGTGGTYIVTLGEDSKIRSGRDDTLPTLDTTINAFTRLWLGVRSAQGLAITDRFAAPSGLLDALDETFRLPDPRPGWDY